ncbi:hypothetical protein RRG08_059033 [Elysia crispata]|uniref:Uncharacterized protein n=1 Tax=Elysia crispata TaxID=231223 RepID=A0AAE1DYQ4_9GAST|nr:hypothetical protein RRG08_059033 [Elysia crispata]
MESTSLHHEVKRTIMSAKGTDVAPAERERKTVRCASTGFGPASSGFQVEATLWRHHSCGAILMATEKTHDDPDEKIQTSPPFLWSENVHHECQVFGEGDESTNSKNFWKSWADLSCKPDTQGCSRHGAPTFLFRRVLRQPYQSLHPHGQPKKDNCRGSVQSVYSIYRAWGLVETDNEENQSCQLFVPMPQCLQLETTDLFGLDWKFKTNSLTAQRRLSGLGSCTCCYLAILVHMSGVDNSLCFCQYWCFLLLLYNRLVLHTAGLGQGVPEQVHLPVESILEQIYFEQMYLCNTNVPQQVILHKLPENVT